MIAGPRLKLRGSEKSERRSGEILGRRAADIPYQAIEQRVKRDAGHEAHKWALLIGSEIPRRRDAKIFVSHRDTINGAGRAGAGRDADGKWRDENQGLKINLALGALGVGAPIKTILHPRHALSGRRQSAVRVELVERALSQQGRRGHESARSSSGIGRQPRTQGQQAHQKEPHTQLARGDRIATDGSRRGSRSVLG